MTEAKDWAGRRDSIIQLLRRYNDIPYEIAYKWVRSGKLKAFHSPLIKGMTGVGMALSVDRSQFLVLRRRYLEEQSLKRSLDRFLSDYVKEMVRDPRRQFLRVRDICRLLQVKPETVYGWGKIGLEHIHLPSPGSGETSQWRVTPEALAKFLGITLEHIAPAIRKGDNKEMTIAELERIISTIQDKNKKVLVNIWFEDDFGASVCVEEAHTGGVDEEGNLNLGAAISEAEDDQASGKE